MLFHRLCAMIFIAFAGVADCSAQLERSWARLYPSALAYVNKQKLVVDSQGNLLVVSQSWATVEPGIRIAKHDPEGALLWERTIGGNDTTRGVPFFDGVNDVTLDSRDNLIVVGNIVNNDTNQDAFVAKYSPTGERLFMHVTDAGHHGFDDWSRAMIGPGDTIYIAGIEFEGPNELLSRATSVLKALTPSGEAIWTTRTPGMTGVEATNFAIVLRPALTDVSLKVKGLLSALPASLIVVRFYGRGAGDLRITNYDPGTGVAGAVREIHSDVFVERSDRPGGQPWVADIGIISTLGTLHAGPHGDLTLFATCSTSQMPRACVVRFNSRGIPRWAVRFDPTEGIDTGADTRGTAVDSAGNCYVGGWSGASTHRASGFIARISNAGIVEWNHTYRSMEWLGGGIALDARGNVFAAGKSQVPSGAGFDYARIHLMAFNAATGTMGALDEISDFSTFIPPGNTVAPLGHHNTPQDMAMDRNGVLFLAGDYSSTPGVANILIAYRYRKGK